MRLIRIMSLARHAGLVSCIGLVAACGGGGGGNTDGGDSGGSGQGTTVINANNYIDVAGLAYVAAVRIEFVADLIDATFQTVIDTNDVPGTYSCAYGGTLSYSKSGNSYIFSASNCDTSVAGSRVLIGSGSMKVDNPVVVTTSPGIFFLTSAAISFSNASVQEAGATSVFSGNVNMAATILNPATSSVRGVGNLDVHRHGRTDSYSNLDVSLLATPYRNEITGGSLTMTSPRAPGPLAMAATTSSSTVSLTATANDNSRATLSTTNGMAFTIDVVTGGIMQGSTVSNSGSPPLSSAIERALQ